jgi:hypothetical protein
MLFEKEPPHLFIDVRAIDMWRPDQLLDVGYGDEVIINGTSKVLALQSRRKKELVLRYRNVFVWQLLLSYPIRTAIAILFVTTISDTFHKDQPFRSFCKNSLLSNNNEKHRFRMS